MPVVPPPCHSRHPHLSVVWLFPSAVIWAFMPAWPELSGPTSQLSTTWRPLATRGWMSSRTRWTTWIPEVTSTPSWTCATRSSVPHSSLSSSPTWGTRWVSHMSPCLRLLLSVLPCAPRSSLRGECQSPFYMQDVYLGGLRSSSWFEGFLSQGIYH